MRDRPADVPVQRRTGRFRQTARTRNDGGNVQMNDETMELVQRHREAAHQQGVIVGIVCTAGAFLIVAVLVKLFGVTCG